jgi:hypothetical protein
VVHLDFGVLITGEDFLRRICMKGLQQDRPEHHRPVIGQERPTGNELVAVRQFI